MVGKKKIHPISDDYKIISHPESVIGKGAFAMVKKA